MVTTLIHSELDHSRQDAVVEIASLTELLLSVRRSLTNGIIENEFIYQFVTAHLASREPIWQGLPTASYGRHGARTFAIHGRSPTRLEFQRVCSLG